MVKKTRAPKAKSGPCRELLSVTVRELVDDYIYRIDLDADYQREKIWSREDQLLLVDSILKNIDIPKIYLAKAKENENFDYECIDGKQRMATLLAFFKPEPDETPLTVSVAGDKYTYKQLRKELTPLAEKIENYELSFVIYGDDLDEEFLRDIFRRLQLGIRLNSGELLKTYTGTIRDFIYKEMGKEPPFLGCTNLSEKRFSRQFTLAQICINSFSRNETGEFVRARYDDLGDFFKDNQSLDPRDENLERIRRVLDLMEKHFENKAQDISSRAVAVSVYLFAEELYLRKKVSLITEFAEFTAALIIEIKRNLNLLNRFENPDNTRILEGFQKYISQASVEPYAIRRRHEFLREAFDYYRSPRGKGKIIRS